MTTVPACHPTQGKLAFQEMRSLFAKMFERTVLEPSIIKKVVVVFVRIHCGLIEPPPASSYHDHSPARFRSDATVESLSLVVSIVQTLGSETVNVVAAPAPLNKIEPPTKILSSTRYHQAFDAEWPVVELYDGV